MAHAAPHENPLYGVMAEFDSVQALVDGSKRAVAAGFTRMEAYSPIPVEELNDIIHKKRTKLSTLTLMGGLTGMATGFGLQYWASAIEYPMNVGGRPYATWTAFVIPSYFNVERFSMASSDKFFLVIEAHDPMFDHGATTRFLQEQGAKGVYDVAA